jgi:hypothetical protein
MRIFCVKTRKGDDMVMYLNNAFSRNAGNLVNKTKELAVHKEWYRHMLMAQ